MLSQGTSTTFSHFAFTIIATLWKFLVFQSRRRTKWLIHVLSNWAQENDIDGVLYYMDAKKIFLGQ